ncbi:hypothetical protein DBP19_35965 [Streptomyces sp. CS090A]|uniref:hypothetical protein n=1 Tax=Streptomyces sp. CS090A TaxID=2162710 RepID=UPI000D520FB9|nr:hypothetical protein [Streptomyces sp. CS090A]PVC80536.1 hypothetical protein DBP19_35965 [Streptomyces sp. CS090A]
MTTTTSYGTWTNQINTYSTGPDADVLDYINGGDADWRELLEKSGAFGEMVAAYRAEIEKALPPDVSLCGTEFIGPWQPEPGDFDGYPVDEDGALDIAACLEGIDLEPIIQAHDPLTLEDIARDELKSTAKEPAKTASRTMSRLGVKAFYLGPDPESGRPRSYFRAGEVRAALADRPGQNWRAGANAGTAL